MGLFCTKCGSKTLPEAKFCGACGNKLKPSASSPEHRFNESTLNFTFNNSSQKMNHRSNLEVKTLFVIGSQTQSESEAWLKSKFPNSKIIRFSTIGAIREAAKRMFSLGQIDSLCLMGTSKTVPTAMLHEEGETESFQPDRPFWSVETDLLYVESNLVIHELPSTESNDPSNFLQRINSQVIEGGIIPLGRIPSDDLSFWQHYFESIESYTPAPTACVAISNYPPNWVVESRAALSEGKNSGCMSQTLYTLGALDDGDLDDDILNDGPVTFAEGSRIIVNLHGGLPQNGEPTQELTTDHPNYSLQLTSFSSFPKAILYLFSCYGGNSGWWKPGGVIPHFLSNGGIAAIASSSVSFVSALDENENIVRGSALMCSEFFKNIDAGLTFGEAIKLAKLKTFMAAMEDFNAQQHPEFFCIAIKEIFQYSLYGAPWATVKPNDNAPKKFANSNSLIDKIRSGQASNTITSTRAGSSTLDQIRKQLNDNLGMEGIKYFTHSKNYVVAQLSKNGKLEQLTNEISSTGFDVNQANFESVCWLGHRYNLAILRDEKKPNQTGMLLVLDDAGNLIAKMEAKG
jgi:hypothetical protein